MWGAWTKEKQAQFNRNNRIDDYATYAIWGFLLGAVPIAAFFYAVFNAPKPVSVTLEGYERDPAPMGGYNEVYSEKWTSGDDHTMSLLYCGLAIIAAAAVIFLIYCIARFIAEPIMYKIDLKTDDKPQLQTWLKRAVMGIVVLLYFGTVISAGIYANELDDKYVWLTDGDTKVRVEKDLYDKYMNNNNKSKDENDSDEHSTESKEPTTEPTTEDLSKTPVERGYPSNDLQYYIDHPNEPMPRELKDELMKPDYYSPY